jgi:hypothetical protein
LNGRDRRGTDCEDVKLAPFYWFRVLVVMTVYSSVGLIANVQLTVECGDVTGAHGSAVG